MKREDIINIFQQGKAIVESVGIWSKPGEGREPIGYSKSGKQKFASTTLRNSTDIGTGARAVNTFKQILDPTGVFSKDDSSKLDQLAQTASNAQFITQLDALRRKKDTKGFMNLIAQKTGQPIINNLDTSSENKAGLGAAFGTYKLYSNWDDMSVAQKGLGVANVGLKSYKFSTGEDAATKNIIAPANGNPGVTVAQGLGFLQAGYNMYDLQKNWDQLNTLGKITQGSNTAASVAQTAKTFNLLGGGTKGAEVGGLTAKGLEAAGWSQSPALGQGAMIGEVGSKLPAGYQSVGNVGGKIVAAPTGTAGVTKNAISNSLAEQGAEQASGGLTAGGIAAGIGVGVGAKQVAESWGKGGTASTVNAAIGGTSMAAGLYSLGVSNPYVLGGIVAASALGANLKSETVTHAGAILNANNPINVLSAKDPLKEGALMLATGGLYQQGRAVLNAVEGGKSKEQKGRDAIRSQFQNAGFVDDAFNVTLADGMKVDIGIDGSHAKRAIFDTSKLVGAHKERTDLNAYDIDYTNDMDYVSGMGGVTLSRIVSGGKADNIDQLGGQLGNAALGSVGFGKEMTQDNFNKVMTNQRGIYAQAGIKNKADAYQLINQAAAEGRINESDQIAAHQTANMMYDQDGFTTAQKLMAGRFKGVEAVASNPTPVARPGTGNAYATKEEVKSRNKAVYEAAMRGVQQKTSGIEGLKAPMEA